MKAKQNTNLADALERARKVAPRGVLKSADLQRGDLERLRRAGYLKVIVKGWYFLVRPGLGAGESTAWYASFWNFLETYLTARFGDDYCLSAVASLELHVGKTTIPTQVVAMTGHGGKTLLHLPHNTSVLVYQDAEGIPTDVEFVEGLHVMPLADALCRLSPAYFRSNPINAELGLRALATVGALVRIILDARSPTWAGRFAGAFAFLGDEAKALDIESAAQTAGIAVRRDNPFERTAPVLEPTPRVLSPHVGRIRAMFQAMRNPVLAAFAEIKPVPVRSPDACIKRIDGIYVHDAYNSLSIEGYRVSEDLIRQIRKGDWNPEADPRDRHAHDAMAAKGYFEAFKLVEIDVRRVLSGEDAARVVRDRCQAWYRAMFSEAVTAGLLETHRLAGYRNGPVYIRNSKHVPPRATAVTDSMDALFDCLADEEVPIVRAVLGHFIFGFIHPYFDGNGRLARFVMNLFLATAGYRWTIIRNDRRNAYLATLERASQHGDIEPFARFILGEMLVDWTSTPSSPKKP